MLPSIITSQRLTQTLPTIMKCCRIGEEQLQNFSPIDGIPKYRSIANLADDGKISLDDIDSLDDLKSIKDVVDSSMFEMLFRSLNILQSAHLSTV